MNDSPASLIALDHQNISADVVGREHGVRSDEFDDLIAQGQRYTDQLKAERESGELGFLDLPEQSLAEMKRFAENKQGSFDHLLVLGIGGSSLGLRALHEALEKYTRSASTPKLRVLDNTDPSSVLRSMRNLSARRTLVLVISKSGGTLETLAALAYVDGWLERAGVERKQHLAVVTGPSSGGGALNRYADTHELERFEVPINVGGRFSVLSPVGMLAATLLGYDVESMLLGAAKLRDQSLAASGSIENAPMISALAHAHLFQRRDKLTSVIFPYASRLKRLGDWYAQLWSESLGKDRDLAGHPVRCGQSVVVAVGASDQHSQMQLFLEGTNDKLLTFIRVEAFESLIAFPEGFDYEGMGIAELSGKDFAHVIHAQMEGSTRALAERKRPNLTLSVPRLDAFHMGALFMFFELQTAYAGKFLNVNPYDQPSVELVKRITRERL